ncbi:ABC transporter substrate-binding protein [Tistrella bauzanensis]
MTIDTRGTWLGICLGLAVMPAMAAETLKIGAPESISGDWAPYTAAHGLRCMAELVNEAGEYRIELLVKDSKSEPQLAIALAQQMLDDEVIAISGTPASDSLIPIGQLAAEYGAITFSAMNTQVEMFAAGLDNFVTVAVPDPHNAAATAKVAYDQGARSVVLFVSDVVGTWTRALPGWFGEVFERQGGKVLGSIEYPGFGITDWSPFISKLKAMDPAPDAIHISSINPDVGVLIRQLRAAGMSTMVLGSDGFDDVTLASVAGGAANVDGTVFFAAHGFPTEGGALAAFQADCAKRGYEINGAFSAWAAM